MGNGILFEIVVGSHFFKVRNVNYKAKALLTEFCKLYTKMEPAKSGPEKGRMVPVRTFANITKDFSEYRFHYNQLGHFFEFMRDRGIPDSAIAVGSKTDFTPGKMEAVLREGWYPQKGQEDAVEFVGKAGKKESRLVVAATGTGKTFMAMSGILKIGNRLAICVLPKFLEKWEEDIKELSTAEKFMTITGTDEIRGAIQLAKENPELLPDVFIISLSTMQVWYRDYEEQKPNLEKYECHPEDFWRVLGVGTIMVDETHEHLNSVWNLMVYSHVDLFIGMTATFITEDRFIEMIHKTMFPLEARCDEIKMERYINVYAMAYDIKDFKDQRLRTTAIGSNNYSHIEFEKTLMKNKPLLKSYLAFIADMVRMGYEERAVEGDTCLVWAATIAFCTELTDYLKERFPHRDVRRYVEDDPYENIRDAEIKVSTPISAGTGLNLKGLIAAIASPSIYSPVQNLQMLGRLRNLKGKEMRYYYPYCNQIKKQVDYHHKRLELYADRNKSINQLKYGTMLVGLPPKGQGGYYAPQEHRPRGAMFGNRPQWKPSNDRWAPPKKQAFANNSGSANRVRQGLHFH